MRCRQRCSPPPARPQGRRVLRDGGLHSGGDEQGESLAARLAGIDLAGGRIQLGSSEALTNAAENTIWPVSRPWEAAAVASHVR